MMRLDRFLSENGFGTRQEVKKIIRAGRVRVNGTVINSPEYKLNEEAAREDYDVPAAESLSLSSEALAGTNRDEPFVTVDGKPVYYEPFYYLMLHKPSGCVSSSHEKGEKTVLDYIDEPFSRELFPVGRLDKDTEGLLLLTNDGALSHRLLSPSRHVDKRYYVKLEHEISKETAGCFEKGIDIGDGKPTLPAKLEQTDNQRYVYVTLHEGRYHQIKRMFEALGNKVVYLKRISMKELTLDETLKPGEYRRLTKDEILKLKS